MLFKYRLVCVAPLHEEYTLRCSCVYYIYEGCVPLASTQSNSLRLCRHIMKVNRMTRNSIRALERPRDELCWSRAGHPHVDKVG